MSARDQLRARRAQPLRTATGRQSSGRSMPAERDAAIVRSALVAFGSFVFVAAAVVIEVITSSAANSPAPAWAEWAVPLAWPQPVRVLWWLVVAGAALAFRVSLHRVGFRQRPIVVLLSVGPFVVFAAGIAVGADWATWH